MEFITNSPEETEKIGAAIGKIIPAGTVLAYRGDLGAGKTAFTRGLARGLNFVGNIEGREAMEGAVSVTIDVLGENTRRITISGGDFLADLSL